ncbi:hypothetical protein FQN60_008840 [Etheostoma spectabile]|uniref:Uncharacterized protein n=1 Tax=Etheostoma spectabile TaxID=54343 RepID=A0A5J5CNX3_9PERO|nr:hypothetical protein FQN60_008840 [Etheostoma spectabile]
MYNKLCVISVKCASKLYFLRFLNLKSLCTSCVMYTCPQCVCSLNKLLQWGAVTNKLFLSAISW